MSWISHPDGYFPIFSEALRLSYGNHMAWYVFVIWADWSSPFWQDYKYNETPNPLQKTHSW